MVSTGLGDTNEIPGLEDELDQQPTSMDINDEFERNTRSIEQQDDINKVLKGDLKTYTDFRKEVLESKMGEDQLYDTIQKKDGKILKAINNTIAHENEKRTNQKYFMEMRFQDIIINMFNVIKETLTFVTESDNLSVDAVINFLKKESRMVYIGLFITIIAVLFMFIQV
jgi:hypothetical protein